MLVHPASSFSSSLNPIAAQYHGIIKHKPVSTRRAPPNVAHAQRSVVPDALVRQASAFLNAQLISQDLAHFDVMPPGNAHALGQYAPAHPGVPFSSINQGSAPLPSVLDLWPCGFPSNVALDTFQRPAPFVNDTRKHRRHHSESAAACLHSQVRLVLDGNGDVLPELEVSGSVHMNEFDRECYFLRYPEEIDPTLSLGQITWLPAVEVHKVHQARPNDRAFDVVNPVDDDCHLGRSAQRLSHATQLVSMTTDDVVSKKFPRECPRIVDMADLRQRYRDRPSPGRKRALPDDTECESRQQKMVAREQSNPAIESTSAVTALQRPSMHARTSSSGSSSSAAKVTRPVPLMPIRDQAQEDILSALGVTGSAQLVYQTPGPAYGPAPSSGPRGNGSKTADGTNLPLAHSRARHGHRRAMSEGPPDLRQQTRSLNVSTKSFVPSRRPVDLMVICEEDERPVQPAVMLNVNRKRVLAEIDHNRHDRQSSVLGEAANGPQRKKHSKHSAGIAKAVA